MRRLLYASCAALVITGAAFAAAPKPQKALILIPGQAIGYGGMTCTAYKGTTPTNANMVCVRNDLKGYGVIISQETIIVAKQQGTKFNVVFRGKNT